ncbi:MAG: hypothetical protein JNL11_15005 [Bdellovibrionaceae bacterium]|nr:hypothetical protein [Pseudobdellovibrionaceae bacterium]
MAYKTVATRWLLSKKDLLKVSFAEHKDTFNLLPNLTDIEVKISVGSLTFSGRGTDLVGDIALEKASSEAVERWCCHKLEISTVGCAIRSTEEDAESSSVSEFIERFYFDQFLEHSFHALRSKTESIAPEAQINYYKLAKTKYGSVILGLVVDSEKPICLGLALEKDLNVGFSKAATEALRNYTVYRENKSDFVDAVSNDHNLWCCNPDLLSKIFGRLSSVPTTSNFFVGVPKFKSITQNVSSILDIKDCPLFFSRTIALGNI